MSMNLNCRGFDLWQTPTQITYMCDKGTTGRQKLEIYRVWVEHCMNRTFHGLDAFAEAKKQRDEHLAALDEFMLGKKQFKVYVM